MRASKAFWLPIRDVEPFCRRNQALLGGLVSHPAKAPVIVPTIPGGANQFTKRRRPDWCRLIEWCKCDPRAVAALMAGAATP